IADHDDAVRHRFLGSPTIRINGRDVVEQADTDYAMRCRVYWVDGRPQDYPNKDTIRAAVRAAKDGTNA
ncbi:MAG: DF family (seleno)protein, partial [bacterium]